MQPEGEATAADGRDDRRASGNFRKGGEADFELGADDRAADEAFADLQLAAADAAAEAKP